MRKKNQIPIFHLKKIIRIKGKKSETLLKENIVKEEEINSLQNKLNYIINDKEIIFKYKNIISDEIDYLFNKIENKETKDKTAEKNLNNLYQEIPNITKEITPKKKESLIIFKEKKS